MHVGSTYIARRPSRNGSDQTIVCFPGFLEDTRYFQGLYHDSDAELILVNNANYHFPSPHQVTPSTQFNSTGRRIHL